MPQNYYWPITPSKEVISLQIYEQLNHEILFWYDSTTLKGGKSCFLKLLQKPIILLVIVSAEKRWNIHNEQLRKV